MATVTEETRTVGGEPPSACADGQMIVMLERSNMDTLEQRTVFGNTFGNIRERVKSIRLVDQHLTRPPEPEPEPQAPEHTDTVTPLTPPVKPAPPAVITSEIVGGYWAEDVGKWGHSASMPWHPTAPRAVPTAISLRQHGYGLFDDILPLDHLNRLQSELAAAGHLAAADTSG